MSGWLLSRPRPRCSLKSLNRSLINLAVSSRNPQIFKFPRNRSTLSIFQKFSSQIGITRKEVSVHAGVVMFCGIYEQTLFTHVACVIFLQQFVHDFGPPPRHPIHQTVHFAVQSNQRTFWWTLTRNIDGRGRRFKSSRTRHFWGNCARDRLVRELCLNQCTHHRALAICPLSVPFRRKTQFRRNHSWLFLEVDVANHLGWDDSHGLESYDKLPLGFNNFQEFVFVIFLECLPSDLGRVVPRKRYLASDDLGFCFV